MATGNDARDDRWAAREANLDAALEAARQDATVKAAASAEANLAYAMMPKPPIDDDDLSFFIDESIDAGGEPCKPDHTDFASVYCVTNDGVIKVERDPGPIRIPKTYSQAVSDPVYGEKWREAMQEDYNGKFKTLKSDSRIRVRFTRISCRS